jgi:hypothetical protein
MKSNVTLLLVFGSLGATAQELPEIDTDRPDQTESSTVLPASTLQIEAGVQLEGDAFESTYSLPATLVRFGALEWLELRAIVEYWKYDGSGGVVPVPAPNGTNLGIGTKIQLTREKGAFPEIALLAHLMTSFEAGDTSSSILAPEFRFSMGHSLPADFALGYNLGGEWNAARETLIGVYTLAVGFPIAGSFGGYVELFGDYDREISSSFDAGITFVPQNNLQIDISGGAGLTAFTPDHYLGVGVSYRYPH